MLDKNESDARIESPKHTPSGTQDGSHLFIEQVGFEEDVHALDVFLVIVSILAVVDSLASSIHSKTVFGQEHQPPHL